MIYRFTKVFILRTPWNLNENYIVFTVLEEGVYLYKYNNPPASHRDRKHYRWIVQSECSDQEHWWCNSNQRTMEHQVDWWSYHPWKRIHRYDSYNRGWSHC